MFFAQVFDYRQAWPPAKRATAPGLKTGGRSFEHDYRTSMRRLLPRGVD